MSGDLVSLRMLLVAATPSNYDLWRQGAGMAALPVEFAACDLSSATNTFARGGADICIVDGDFSEPETAAVIKIARARQPAPLVFLSARAGSKRPEGVDGMLDKPSTVDDARRLAELCIRTKIPTRVLIVDDSGTMRSIVRKILTASRFALDLYEAAEGFDALGQLRGGQFGLVFLDYNMPGLNGFETLHEIKRENPKIAVVMMTSTVDAAVAERAQNSGALAFLKKPFYPADIDRLLERYFGLHGARV
jgi:CheY-like chemotaxis protein